MRITNVKVTHHASSAWGDFCDREDELHLVTAMAVYPQYKHPISTWRAPEGMCVVEVETDQGLSGIGWCEDYCRATSQMVEHFPVPVWMRHDQPETEFFDGAPSPVDGKVTLGDQPGIGYNLKLPETSKLA